MGKRGPPKIPTATLSARGSWLAKTRQAEPQADGVADPPAWLTDSEREVWDRLLPRLESMGVVGAIDENSLAIYATLYARWLECERWIEDNGAFIVVENESGEIVKSTEHPLVRRASKLADQLIKLGQQYGMTASSRESLGLET